MDDPKSIHHLQRHSSLPPRLQRHATLLRRRSTLTRRPTVVRNPWLNKTNPYVGFFRHSPPSNTTERGSLLERYRSNAKMALPHAPSTLFMKSSPYIGWFRHAPPSRLNLQKKRLAKLEQDLSALLAHVAKHGNESCHCQSKDPVISGHLKGGAPDSYASHRVDRNVYESLHRSLQESSAGSTSATIKVLTRLASWFLFPLAHDDDACGYRHCPNQNSTLSHMFPHLFPSFLTNALREDDEKSHCSSENDDGSSVGTVPNDFPNDVSDDLSYSVPGDIDISVSSLAEAYYAHQAVKEIDESTLGNMGDESYRLDYVITQMDIARMARNASRHLDVASILSLPTITYHSSNAASEPSQEQQPGDNIDIGWSWMIVPPNPSSQEERPNEDDENKVCVICLEHFVDGDRLRVLPCNHSFHVGCIDRWLSGSHSFEDCYTSGCPTCKKRPEIMAPPLDGSVPSWAFARIGDALAKDSATSWSEI